jgi:hypothetical protein
MPCLSLEKGLESEFFFNICTCFLEFWPFNFNYWYTIDVPKTIEKMGSVNDIFTVLNIPFSYSNATFSRNSHGLFLQTIHRKFIIDGHISRKIKGNLENLDLVMKYLKEENQSELKILLNTLKIEYVIIAKNMFEVAKILDEEVNQQIKLLEIGEFCKVDENNFFVVYQICNRKLLSSF